MTDDGRRETGPGDESPWAPGGSMSQTPIPKAPSFFEPSAPAPQRRHDGAPPPGSSAGTRQPTGGEPPAGILASKWVRFAAIGAAVIVAAAGVLVIARDSGSGEPAAEPEPTVTTTEAPATSTTNPDPFADASVGPPTEVLVGGTGDGFDRPLDVPVGLPPVLDELAPTELIVLGSEGQMYQVTTSTQLARPLTLGDARSRFAATDDSGVIWNDVADSIGVLRRGRDPIELPVQDIGAVVAEADEEFLVAPTAAGAEWRELRIDPVVRTAELDIEVGLPWSVWPHPGGELMVTDNEGDGTLLLGPDGPTPISSGPALGTGRNHVLFQECDEADTCVYLLEGPEGERSEPPGLVGFEPPQSGPVHISPDGGALVRFDFDQDGTTQLGIVDLQSGAMTEVTMEPGEPIVPPARWSPDGRGVFAIAGDGVVFVDRATGESTPLPGVDELLAGDPVQIAVRPVPAPEVIEGSIVVTLTGLTGLDLVALAPDGDVVRIDIDGRATVRYEGQPLLSGAPAYLFPDETGVTVASSVDVAGFRLDYGRTPVETPGDTFVGRILPGPGLSPDRFWQVPEFVFGESELTLVDAVGTPLGDPIVIENSFVLGSDGTGSVLLYTAGADYVVGPEGAARLTDGEVVALGATTAYARECDEVLSCRIVRIDRVSGARIPVDVLGLETATADPAGLATFGQTVSPDGDVVFVQVSANSLAWLMIDLAAGTVLEVPGPGRVTPIVWSNDSQYAAYVSGDILRVYDRAAGVLKDLSQLPRIKTFTEFVPPAGDEAEPAADGFAAPKSFQR